MRALPWPRRLAPGLYYGWIVVLGMAAVSFVAVGIGFYGQTVLLDALTRLHGWSKASVSGAASVYFVVSAASGALVGRGCDRFGSRIWLAVGSVGMALCLLVLGWVVAIWQLYGLFALMAVGYSMAGNVPASALVARWFVERRALAMSLSYTGISLGGIVLVPAAARLIEAKGLSVALMGLAGLLVAVALPIIGLALREEPGAFGLPLDGRSERAPQNPLLRMAWQQRTWRGRDATRTASFWILALSFSGILFCQMSILVHALALFRETLDTTAAALGVSGIALGSALGRIALGAVADRLDKRRLTVGLFVLQALTLLVFSSVRGNVALYAASFVFGTTVGNVFMLQSLLVGELFGMASFGRIFGILQLFTQMAGGLGPFALGVLYEHFGGYDVPLRALAGIALVSAAVIAQVRPPVIRPGPEGTSAQGRIE